MPDISSGETTTVWRRFTGRKLVLSGVAGLAIALMIAQRPLTAPLPDTVEIADMTQWFLDHTVEDQGFRRVVEPKIVLEVAFNNMMRSERHESGYALRFPRIVRLRPDKSPEEADTIERAREIYSKQASS